MKMNQPEIKPIIDKAKNIGSEGFTLHTKV